MMIVKHQTREEKIAMYMKLSKREIIDMLLNNQELVENLSRQRRPRVVRQERRPFDWDFESP